MLSERPRATGRESSIPPTHAYSRYQQDSNARDACANCQCCTRELLNFPIRPSPADEPLHQAHVVVLGELAVLSQVWPVVRRHRLHHLLDDFVGDECVTEVQLGNVRLLAISLCINKRRGDTHLPVCYFPEAGQHLLRRVLVLRHVHHESDELLECHELPPAAAVQELVVHL